MSYATERLIKNARTSLPGSLDNVILLELFNVLDKFFRDTSIWTEDVPFSVNRQGRFIISSPRASRPSSG
jgi:hypothetical protein